MDRYLLWARLVSRRPIRQALVARSFAKASRLTNLRCVSDNFFSFELADEPSMPSQLIQLRFAAGRCHVGLSAALIMADQSGDQDRLLDALEILSGCRNLGDGSVALNIGDFGNLPGLAFSENRPGYTLIPDPYYVCTTLNRPLAQQFHEKSVPWSQRRPVVFWRGSTTGSRNGPDWESLDRVRLCRIGQADPSRFDIGFTDLPQVTAAEQAEIRLAGLMREHVHLCNFDRYRYQIDLDGNCNSWGYFSKLLTGSPVLKVASPTGYRQWYYDRLLPWQHFVPVAHDLSDLVERVDWLFEHEAEARAIGAAARAMALSMTLKSEIRNTRAIVASAMNNSRNAS